VPRALISVEEKSETDRQRLQSIYSKEVGVREKTNKNDGERIANYLNYTGLPEGYAWCAAFVSWSFGEAGFKEPKTAWSPALFPKKTIIWNRGPVKKKSLGNLKIADSERNKVGNEEYHLPAAGDVFGIYFASLKRIAHAGFVDEWGDKYVITVEGNTNNGGGREGDGVYRKRRPVSSIYQVAKWL